MEGWASRQQEVDILNTTSPKTILLDELIHFTEKLIFV